MQNFQDTFETRKGSFISAFSICMTVPLKSNLSNSEPKLVNYRDYKKFSFEKFKTSLDNVLRHCSTDFKVFEYNFTSQKTKVIRGNHKTYLNKKLRKAIMLIYRLKNKANKTKSDMQPTRSSGIMWEL